MRNEQGVGDRISFVEGNLFSTEPPEPRFDFIVSNPPYVSTAEMAELPRDVNDHEPDLALRAGETGTDVIAPLIEQAAERSQPGGTLLIEISPMIAAAVEQLIREQPSLKLGPTIRDHAGHARIVQATRKKKLTTGRRSPVLKPLAAIELLVQRRSRFEVIGPPVGSSSIAATTICSLASRSSA